MSGRGNLNATGYGLDLFPDRPRETEKAPNLSGFRDPDDDVKRLV
ncbi:Protein kinase domain-containing protein [Psidium guajava]|nr:Protein kinase domain-containing protein [Psidium guajava]